MNADKFDKALEEFYKIIKDNPSDETYKFMMSVIGENHVSNLVKGKVKHEKGYDIINENTDKTYEVKTACISTKTSITNSYLCAYNLASKFEKCDYIVLNDATYNTRPYIRTSIIPHDEFFRNGKIDRFIWSSSYNESDNIQVENTQLFLQYEVTE